MFRFLWGGKRMKKLKCPECKREREVEDNIVMVICPSCQCKMEIIKDE